MAPSASADRAFKRLLVDLHLDQLLISLMVDIIHLGLLGLRVPLLVLLHRLVEQVNELISVLLDQLRVGDRLQCLVDQQIRVEADVGDVIIEVANEVANRVLT